ncbi:hypothetical protein PR202_ga15950 [Eleusine coracana subsp. coracana]|uniref:AN1-type domain-containing protein n=1 Tax=Eleusine coracana subsp. coracana TaxID=191504 RepID=A0AAV5CKR5_ELECO|nr:hypothetical protein QOZ80_6BG0487320 [Eleusine coracana subsp. coracana]GJM98898.1 hypothetical protein PR202_ga15950 [Eleusine coracana subsp. coracana]
MARRGGTEAFPDLGAHCDNPDCNQLDFLPFVCDGCDNTFCAEHRTYMAHACANKAAADQGRTVVVCEACGAAIERTSGGQNDEQAILAAHARSRQCDPAKKRKPRRPAARCRETLTFSNTSQCKRCEQKVCLKHRFPGDHECAATIRAAARAAAEKRVASMCGRDAQKKKKTGGGGFKLPPIIGKFLKMF